MVLFLIIFFYLQSIPLSMAAENEKSPLHYLGSADFLLSKDKRDQWWESAARNFRGSCSYCKFSVRISDQYGILWGGKGIYSIEPDFKSKDLNRLKISALKEIFKKDNINTCLGYPVYPQLCLKDKISSPQTLLSTPYMPEYLCDSEDPEKLAAAITVDFNENGDPRYKIKYNKAGWEQKLLDYPKQDVSPLYPVRPITFSTDGYQRVGMDNLPNHHELFFENNITRPLKSRDKADLTYHMYVPKEFYLTQKPLPVIFKVYGGGSEEDYEYENSLNLERFLAYSGCIVIVLKGEKMPKVEAPGASSTRINYKNFPQKLFEDIQDVYTILTKSKEEGGLWTTPYIQKGHTKVFLYGGSFGGGVVLRMATDPVYGGLFDGYISFAGEFDYGKNIKERAGYEQSKKQLGSYDFDRKESQNTQQKLYYFAKNYLIDEEYNKEISPIYHLDNLQKPLLAVQGIEDYQVSPKESTRLGKAAIKANKDHLIRLHFMYETGHDDPRDFKRFKESYETYLTFISDIIDDTYTEKQKSLINRALKQYKIREAKGQIKAKNPILLTRGGQWEQLLRDAWRNSEKHPDLYKLLKEKDLSTEDSQILFEDYLSPMLQRSSDKKKQIRIFNLLNQKRFGDQVRESILTLLQTKGINNKEILDAVKDIDAFELEDKYGIGLPTRELEKNNIKFNEIQDTILMDFRGNFRRHSEIYWESSKPFIVEFQKENHTND